MDEIVETSYDDRFNVAVRAVLRHEGSYSNDPDDPGGATKYGISLRFLKEMGIETENDPDKEIADVKDIYFTDAVEIYKKYWWDKYSYNSIIYLPIATKVFDMAVNMGPISAHKITQRACNYCGSYNLTIDGVLGEKSFFALNDIYYNGGSQKLMNEIIHEQKLYYAQLIHDHPGLEVFRNGWLNRASYEGT